MNCCLGCCDMGFRGEVFFGKLFSGIVIDVCFF